MIRESRSWLPLLLWAVAMHSAAIGISLITLPPAALQAFGIQDGPDRFFRTQGGVFHLVVAAAYAMAASNPPRFRILVVWTILVKFAAMVFLLTYHFAVEAKPLFLLSGLGDGAMGAVILAALRKSRSG